MTKTKLNEAICKKMFVIGIPTSLLGFKYIREAILKCYEEPEYKYQITKGLYPAIAKQKRYDRIKSRKSNAACHRNSMVER